jgi:hypothetical protein
MCTLITYYSSEPGPIIHVKACMHAITSADQVGLHANIYNAVSIYIPLVQPRKSHMPLEDMMTMRVRNLRTRLTCMIMI